MTQHKLTIKDAFTGHFLGDFVFQNDWMAGKKSQGWEGLVYHALAYSAAFRLVGETSPLRFAVLALSHGLIDTLRVRWKVIPTIWLDQALHGLILQLVYADPKWKR